MKIDEQKTSASQRKGGFWSRARIAFRWSRIIVLTFILFGLAVVLWCNYLQVPRPLSGLVIAELRRKNINLEFSHLRLRGVRHVIAQDLRFTSLASNDFPQFEARAAELFFDFRKLRQGEVEISGLRLEQGRLSIPIHASNQPPQFLIVSNLASDIDFLPDDTVRITRFSGEALGTKAEASGLVRNFSKYVPQTGTKGGEGLEFWKKEVRDISDLFEHLKFDEPPVISLKISGDAADLTGLRGSITVSAAAAHSEWGSFSRFELASGVFSMKTNASVAGRFRFELDGFRSRWGSIGFARLDADSIWSHEMDQLLTNTVTLSISNVNSRWGKATGATASVLSRRDDNGKFLRTTMSARAAALEASTYALGESELQGTFQHALPFPTPAAWLRHFLHNTPTDSLDSTIAGEWTFQSSGIRMPRATLDSIHLTGQWSSGTNQSESILSSNIWRYVATARIPWRLAVSNILSEQIKIGTLDAAGDWSWPRFGMNQIAARLYDGKLAGNLAFNVETRQAHASVEGDFDYKKIARLLDKPVQRWLDQFSWEKPPVVQASMDFRIPASTNGFLSIEKRIVPTLAISGKIEGGASFRGIVVEHAKGPFFFSNYVWRLPELQIIRPEGVTTLDYTGNVTNADFSCQIRARLDPTVLKPFLTNEAQQAFKIVRFTEAPLIVGQAKGNWDRQNEIAFQGRFEVTNLYVREKPLADVGVDFAYSNLVMECWNASAHLGTGFVTADLRLDFRTEQMLVTNGFSTVDPYDAMFMVGPESYKAIDPYRFAIPPMVKVNGLVPLRHFSKADLWFDIVGTEFSFWKFKIPRLAGTVHWRGNELWITNISASFYGGSANWDGYFKIRPKDDAADFQFRGYVRDANLKHLIADVFGQTNHMDGLASGTLVVTSANSKDPLSWNGHGEATLRDGFLWSVPVFGIFTPVLDALVPGSAMSRVTSGQGHFSITNSVVHTRDFQVRAKAFRLNYKGSVDLDGKLDALVDAEILRDAWILGKVVSVALWPISKAFEARISGSVNQPKTHLRYFPRFLLAPFKALGAQSEGNKNRSASQKE